MRRLALLLAATVLGTGCIVTSDDTLGTGDFGTVNLYWDFARHAPAQTGGFIYYDESLVGTGNQACAQSAVDTIRVIPPGGNPFDVTCVYNGVQGITIDGVPAGNRIFRVIGYRQAVAVFDSDVAVPVRGGTSTDAIADVVGVPGALDLFGDLAFGTRPSDVYASCAAAGAPNLSYEVKDAFGLTVDGGTVGCSDPLPSPVFAGNLDLDDYKVRMQGFELGTNALVFDSCWFDVSHFAAQTGQNGVALTLLTPPPSCPAFP
jgi:hypothetical protein